MKSNKKAKEGGLVLTTHGKNFLGGAKILLGYLVTVTCPPSAPHQGQKGVGMKVFQDLAAVLSWNETLQKTFIACAKVGKLSRALTSC
jgi:hypothetical protein